MLSPPSPALEVRGLFRSALGVVVSVLAEARSSSEVLEWDDWADLDDGCDGIVAGEVGVEVLDSTAGLGFARLREPMAQIEHGEVRLLPKWSDLFSFCYWVCVCRVGRRRCRR